MPSATAQPWLYSRTIDLLFVTGPAFIVSVAVLVIFTPSPEVMRAELSLGLWLLFVLGVDVAHVYSTLYRTYCDPEERARYATHLTLIPLFCWITGILLYSIGPLVFWSLLAYTAVFHFVRQQYGFYALYARLPTDKARAGREIDTAAVYLAAIYPLVYWHEHLPRSFVWFVEGDFPIRAPHGSALLTGWLLMLVLGMQLSKEILVFVRTGALNIPKNLVIWGTVLSWYTGIVYFNGDVPFTITNVVAHGVPYIALIWIFGNRKVSRSPERVPRWLALVCSPRGIALFVLALLCLAFVEEALWDSLVWREHEGAFGWAWMLPQVESPKVLALVVPLLAVPQATHYVLDAFIWRIRRPSGEVTSLLLRGM